MDENQNEDMDSHYNLRSFEHACAEFQPKEGGATPKKSFSK